MHSVGSRNERKHVCSLGRICEPTSGYCAKPEVLTSAGILVKIITAAFLLHKQDALLLQKQGNHWGRVCIGDRRPLPFGPRRAQVAGETETRGRFVVSLPLLRKHPISTPSTCASNPVPTGALSSQATVL